MKKGTKLLGPAVVLVMILSMVSGIGALACTRNILCKRFSTR